MQEWACTGARRARSNLASAFLPFFFSYHLVDVAVHFLDGEKNFEMHVLRNQLWGSQSSFTKNSEESK